jgi:hypothetical protein
VSLPGRVFFRQTTEQPGTRHEGLSAPVYASTASLCRLTTLVWVDDPWYLGRRVASEDMLGGGQTKVSSMRYETWLSALVAAPLFFWLIGGTAPGICAEPGTTAFGRPLMAVLDDENPLVRAQGWSFLGWLGTLSNPNPLHTETFKRVVREDGKPLAQRVDGLLSRLRDKNLSPDEARAASSEFDALRNAALGVPEIAALLVASARLDQSVPASDLDQIKQASARVRQASRPALLRSASAKETEALIATLASRSPNDRNSRLDAANKVTTVQLTAAQVDALEPLAKDNSAIQ